MHIVDKPCPILLGDSLADAANYIGTAPRLWSQRLSETLKPERDWDFGVGYNGALALARDGWPEGAAQMDAGLRATPAPNAAHAKRMYDVAGHYPDVARYISGDPSNMVRRGKVEGKKPALSIVAVCGYNAHVTAAQLAAMGVAMCSVIDALEAGGRRVELTTLFKSTIGGAVGWRVKQAEDALDLSSIAFSIAHPAALRRLGFALIERLPCRLEPSYGNGAGTPMEAAELASVDLADALVVDLAQIANYASAVPRKAVVKALNEAAGETIVEEEQ